MPTYNIEHGMFNSCKNPSWVGVVLLEQKKRKKVAHGVAYMGKEKKESPDQ